MKGILIFVFVPLMLCASCTKGTTSYSGTEGTEAKVKISNNDINRKTNIVKIHGSLGKYSNYLEETDYSIGVSSSRFSPKEKENISAFFEPYPHNHGIKSLAHITNNDITINGDKIFVSKRKRTAGEVYEMFGRHMNFAIRGTTPMTKGDDCLSIELYAPEIVRIESPYAVAEGLIPLCYYQNFTVKWNSDENNTNGVVIVIAWDGSMLFGDDYQSSMVYQIVCVPDSGSAELDESMFEGIPDAAVCRMYVIRGDIENLEIDETNYQLMVRTNDSSRFILIRNIEGQFVETESVNMQTE